MNFCRVCFLCAVGVEGRGRTEGFGIPSPRFLTLPTWSYQDTDFYWPSQYSVELCGLIDINYLTLMRVHTFMAARGGAVGAVTALRVRILMESLGFFIDLIISAVLWP
jgi:hypothetical protein